MKIRTKNKLLAIAVSVVAIFIPSFLFNKWIEGVVFFVCHWFIREQYPKQYHHIMPSMCRLISSIVFFFGISFVFPLALSLFSVIPINYFIGWIGFTKKEADYYEYKYYKLKSQLNEKKEFSTDTCTESELIERCKELNFKPQQIDLCVELFIMQTKQSELADKYSIQEKSLQQQKRRLKQKLNKK